MKIKNRVVSNLQIKNIIMQKEGKIENMESKRLNQIDEQLLGEVSNLENIT